MASGRFSTDLLGLPFLLDALACDGYAAEAIAGVRNVCARMLDEEGTTCFETREAKRSAAGRAYCQGASAFAGTYMLRLLAGIRPAPYPRRQVRIQPCCADLEWLTATLPLPDGEVTVQIENTPKGMRLRTTVPLGWTGVSEPPAVSSATM